MNEILLEKLKEIYLFVGYGHKELSPWGEALDEWRKEVEKETGWIYYNEFQKKYH